MGAASWSKFFWSDWRSDPALRSCSLAARGLWMEMLGIMHEAAPRGQLLINGNPPSVDLLASLSGCSVEETSKLLSELEAKGVFSRKRSGIIFSRRMERDEIKSKKAVKNGKMGGNPSLRKTTKKEASVNPPDNTEDKPQRPEARNQKPEREEREEPPKIIQQRELVDEPRHRALIADLRSRGGDLLTDWEKQFLGSIYGLKNLTRKQREQFDTIRQKVTEMADASRDKGWLEKLVFARKHKQWGVEEWGPMPGKAGCRVPAHLLQPGDGEGWTEWRAAS